MFTKSSILSPKYAKKKRRRQAARGFFIALLCVVILGSFSYVVHLPTMRIEDISITGATTLSEKELLALVREKISGDYFWLIPRDSVFFYPADAIITALVEAYPRILTVGLTLEDLTTLHVSLAEKKPYALWCEGELGETKNCSFLDERGMPFTSAPDFSGNVFFRYYGLVSRLSADEFSRIDSFRLALEKNDIPVVALSAEPNGEFVALVKNSDGEASFGRILFNNRELYDKTLENIKTIWAEKIKPSAKKSAAAFDYIDLRYGNKVYFKIR